jgi:hypothetical protein
MTYLQYVYCTLYIAQCTLYNPLNEGWEDGGVGPHLLPHSAVKVLLFLSTHLFQCILEPGLQLLLGERLHVHSDGDRHDALRLHKFCINASFKWTSCM